MGLQFEQFSAHFADRPAESNICRLGDKFESTGSVNNKSAPVRQRNGRSAENITADGDCLLRILGRSRD